ncbi:MAG: site-specific integrase [Cyclobacteriaceae bacterium]
MANHTFSALCIVRASRSKSSLLPIYLRITVDGKRSEISTKEYVAAAKWNSQKGRIKGNSEDVRLINARLDTWETKVKEHYNLNIRDEKRISAQVLKDAVLGVVEKSNDFISQFEAHEREVKSKIGIDYSKGTHKNYVATLKHLRNFLSNKYRGGVVTLKDLDYDFIEGFESYLKLEVGNSNNGAIKHIQRLKKVVHLAIKRGKITNNPFAAYKVKKEKVNREFLSPNELRTIEDLVLTNKTLETVRDLFVFTCYTGASYSDLADLTCENVGRGVDGNLWLTIERNKTGVVARIPLLFPAKRIMDKYANHPASLNSGSLLPVMSNQKMNHYLKKVAEMCSINKPVTCHIGRHTFATTITLSNDIPIETVSQMLGHTCLRTTQIYAKVIEKKVSHDMSKLNNLYSSEPHDEAVNQ